MKSIAIISILFLSSTFPLAAQNSHSVLKKGDESYKKGEFAEAQKHYEVAYSQKDKPAQSAYNLGNTYFMQAGVMKPELYKNAVNYFEQAAAAAKEKSEKANAHYNRGNALLQQSGGTNLVADDPSVLGDAIEAYKEALRLNPSDKDARHNLAFALQKKKKQEEEQKKKEQEQKDKKQQNDPKQDEENKDKPKDPKQDEKDKQNEKEQQQQSQAQKSNPKKAETERLMQLIQNEEQNTRKKMLQQQMPQPSPNGKSW